MVGTVKYRDSIEYRDTFSRYVSSHKISGIAQHYPAPHTRQAHAAFLQGRLTLLYTLYTTLRLFDFINSGRVRLHQNLLIHTKLSYVSAGMGHQRAASITKSACRLQIGAMTKMRTSAAWYNCIGTCYTQPPACSPQAMFINHRPVTTWCSLPRLNNIF